MSNPIQDTKANIASLVDSLNSILNHVDAQEEENRTLREKLTNNDGLVVDWPALRKVFLLGAKLGSEQTVYYIKGEMNDYEYDIYEDTHGDAYLNIQGSVTIQAEDICDRMNIPASGTKEDHDQQMLDLLSMDEQMVMSEISLHLNPPAPQTDEESK